MPEQRMPRKCGAREWLIQPGGWVRAKCDLAPLHEHNHLMHRRHGHTLEWGDEPLGSHR